MYMMFYSTSDVFEAEEKINDAGIDCKVVPTPVTDKAYCGVCIQTNDDKAFVCVKGMEYEVAD